jgi:hypothetical protein
MALCPIGSEVAAQSMSSPSDDMVRRVGRAGEGLGESGAHQGGWIVEEAGEDDERLALPDVVEA